MILYIFIKFEIINILSKILIYLISKYISVSCSNYISNYINQLKII